MQNHNDDTIKTSDTVLRKIYLSLYLKGRGSWRPNRTATFWPPLLWPSPFFSCSPGLLNRGPGAQPLWVLVFSTASYLQLVWSPTDYSGAEGSLCWVLAFSTASWLQLVWSPNWLNFLCTKLYNSSTPTFFWWHSFNLSTVKVIISWSTGCTCYLHRYISYFDSPAES